VDEACFRRRVREAVAYRRRFRDFDSCRLIFAESDFLPALIVDKFSDVLAVQCPVPGHGKMEGPDRAHPGGRRLRPGHLHERDDVPVRRLEGMEQVTGLLYGEVPDRVEMTENGVRYLVDCEVRPEDRLFSGPEGKTAPPSGRWRKARGCWTASATTVPSR
jgi:23S rRNA (cytosine1962-C5)-methyltransferase